MKLVYAALACRTATGKPLRVERALELCGPLAEEMRRQAKP